MVLILGKRTFGFSVVSLKNKGKEPSTKVYVQDFKIVIIPRLLEAWRSCERRLTGSGNRKTGGVFHSLTVRKKMKKKTF